MYSVAKTQAVGTNAENMSLVHAAVAIALRDHVTNLAAELTPIPNPNLNLNPTVKAYRTTKTVLERDQLQLLLRELNNAIPTYVPSEVIENLTLNNEHRSDPCLTGLDVKNQTQTARQAAGFIRERPNLAGIIGELDQQLNTNTLSVEQDASAVAIASGRRLVTIVGPAGTGKTTMIKTAKLALEEQGRRMVILAPYK